MQCVLSSRHDPEALPSAPGDGTLGVVRPEHIILALRSTARSGTLVFGDASAPLAQFVFEAGCVRKARSSLSAYLGGVLYELGYVDPPTLNASLSEVAARGVPHGTLLREHGDVAPEMVQLGLREQMERRLAGVIGLPPDAIWRFHDAVDLLPSFGGSDWPLVDPAPGIWRGLRESALTDIVRKALAACAATSFVLGPGVDLRALRMRPDEVAVAELFRSPRSLLAPESTLSPEATAALLYFLLLANVLVRAPTRSEAPRALSSPPPLSARPSLPPADPLETPTRAVERTRAFLVAGNYLKARALAVAALERFPGSWPVAVEHAWVLAHNPDERSPADLDRHLRHLDELIRTGGESAQSLYYRFQLRRRAGRGALALRDLRQAVVLDPHHVDAVRELRLFNARLGKDGSVEAALGIAPPQARDHSSS